MHAGSRYHIRRIAAAHPAAGLHLTDICKKAFIGVFQHIEIVADSGI